ncbi:copper chaperone PCu(A)C [Phaeovulum sp.]|uniref:copper chaperone PCu(A)C n=1 Tax=Phaeovulum sp. TaxID=2934796 RepID=UPI003567DDAF
MKRLLTLALALFVASPALAQDVIVNGIHIIHPYITAPAPGSMSGAAYLVVANEGATADRFDAVETDIAMMAALHNTEFGADGVARMYELPPIPLAPGETVSFEPGGAHIMLMMLNAELNVGDMVPMTLSFQNAGEIVVEFEVMARDPNAPAMSH